MAVNKFSRSYGKTNFVRTLSTILRKESMKQGKMEIQKQILETESNTLAQKHSLRL